jgi:competence protein ComEC
MEFFRRAPIIKLLLFFVIGIINYLVFPQIPIPILLLKALVILCIISLFFVLKITSYQHRWLFGNMVSMVFLIMGYIISYESVSINQPNHFHHRIDNQQKKVLVEVEDVADKSDKTFRVVANVLAINNETYDGKILTYLKKDSISVKPSKGQFIKFSGYIQQIQDKKNPNEFEYGAYLKRKDIFHQVYTKEWDVVANSMTFSVLKIAENLRNNLLQLFQDNGLEGKEFAIASALILGYKASLDSDLMKSYASAGATHVLAVSGLHVGIIFLIFNSLLGFLDKNKKGLWLKTALILIVLWGYALITGLSPSVLRASTMFSFIVIGNVLNRNADIYNTIAASALLLLVVNPFMLLEVGFQLSYIAVVGIIYIQPKLYALWQTDQYFLDKIWQLSTVSVAAQIATFPLGLFYFHQFPNYFLLSNLFVIPLATLVVYGGILVVITSSFSIVSHLFAQGLMYTIKIMNYLVLLVDELPYAVTNNVFINSFELTLIYLIIITFFAYLMYQKFKLLMTALGFVLLFSSFGMIEALTIRNSNECIIYNAPKHGVYHFRFGAEHVVMADSLFYQNNGFNYYVQPNIAAVPTDTCYQLIFDSKSSQSFSNMAIYKQFLQFDYQKWMIIHSSLDLEFISQEHLPVDYVIFSAFSPLDTVQIKKLANCKEVILDSSVPYSTVQKMKSLLSENNIPYYIVAEMGAYVKRF